MATGATTAPSIVSGTTPLPKSSNSPGGSTLGATTDQTIAGNFQTFLTLLTTQLQNQNPLDPLDTNQFTQQLVQFAGVEQQLKTNDSLATLVSLQQTMQATQALQFVGKTAIVDGNVTAMSDAKATWELNVAFDVHDHRQYHQQHRPDRLHRKLLGERRRQPAFRLGRQGQRRHAISGRALQADRDRAGLDRQHGGDLDPGWRRRERGGPHPIATDALDQRPKLHHEPDQGDRRRPVLLTSRHASSAPNH